MISELRQIKTGNADIRKFGITVGIVLMIIAGFLLWSGNDSFQLVFIIGLSLMLLGIAIPIILKPVYLVWMILATIMGWIMTRLILSLLFYVIITPIGIIARIFGKQFLELKWVKSKKSYWNYRESSEVDKGSYEKQF